jgi:plasmid stabilization system protein ParE
MAYRLIYSEESLAELEAILDFIEDDNAAAVGPFASSLFDHLDLLESFPHMGSRVDKRPRVRKLLHSPIRVYYAVDDQRRLITILHFWHTSRCEPPLK